MSLTVSREQTIAVFEGLYRIVRNVSNPAECSSAERCIFSYLYELFASSDTLLMKIPLGYEFRGTIYGRIHQAIFSEVTTVPNHVPWNTAFMTEAIMTYRRGGKLYSNEYII